VKIGGAKKYSVTIKGETPRTIKVKTTVTNPALENAYLLLGGKSGTLGTAVNNASILAQVKEGTFTFVSIVMKSSTTTSRYEDTKKLLDVILKKMENPHYIPTEKFTAVSLAGVLLPNNPLFWTNLDKLPTYGYYGLNES
jgi:D-alanyl-D-alanine carboxypeptidase